MGMGILGCWNMQWRRGAEPFAGNRPEKRWLEKGA